jgi:hypothetical protein
MECEKGDGGRVVDEGWKIRVERSGGSFPLELDDETSEQRSRGKQPCEPTQNFLLLPVRVADFYGLVVLT